MTDGEQQQQRKDGVAQPRDVVADRVRHQVCEEARHTPAAEQDRDRTGGSVAIPEQRARQRQPDDRDQVPHEERVDASGGEHEHQHACLEPGEHSETASDDR